MPFNKTIKLRSDNVSGFLGVSWHHRDKSWQASIRADGKLIFLGLFSQPEFAAAAYDAAAVKFHGDRATTNLSLRLLPVATATRLAGDRAA